MQLATRERRYKFFAVTPELMLQSMFGPAQPRGESITVEGLPDGFEPTDIVYDFERRAFLIRVWHESFDVVPDCACIPEVRPMFTVVRREDA